MYFIDDQELHALKEIFETKKLFRYQVDAQSQCQLFEEEFAKYLGVAHAVLVNSGTNALVAALMALDVGPEDEVIIPSYTFYATAQAVALVGATPVVVNINQNFGMDRSELERALTKKTKAIIPVHMDGLSSNVAEICAFAQNHQLVVIEDCAQALGGSFQGKRLGSFGRISCFSLNKDKNISCGEGGIVVTNDEELYRKLFYIQDGSASFNPANAKFFKELPSFIGPSMRVSEISGALARVQLKRLEGILALLRKRKEIYREALGEKLLEGSDPQGDCGNSLHLRFPSVDEAQAYGKKLREKGFMVYPPQMKPGHSVLKWGAFLAERKKMNYRPGLYLPTLELLSSTLKLDIAIDWSEEKTKEEALCLAQILAS